MNPHAYHLRMVELTSHDAIALVERGLRGIAICNDSYRAFELKFPLLEGESLCSYKNRDALRMFTDEETATEICFKTRLAETLEHLRNIYPHPIGTYEEWESIENWGKD